jgi:hypothetical protein
MHPPDRHECAHGACHCAVPGEDQFCSERCRAEAKSPSSGAAEAFGMKVCGCGHAACLAHDEGEQVQ